MRAFHRWVHNNGLSVIFFLLFICAFGIQAVTGLHAENDARAARHDESISFSRYLTSGSFLDSVFVNWQAAILQLACLVLFSTFLYQKGAAHSRKPDADEGVRMRRRYLAGSRFSWIYRNSLTLALMSLFLASLAAHAVFGNWAYNDTRALAGEPPISVASYLGTGDFWSKTTETWQAEFIAILLFLVFSIFLRQEGSAESKPVESGNKETGVKNE